MRAWALIGVLACTGNMTTPNEGVVTLTDPERAALSALSPETLPAPPKDPSNRWADDDGAAAFGKTLFFDPSLSGALVEGDNDGSPTTLGTRGETGKVACAGCHVPSTDFLDSRTLGREVSLAAGWGKRRAPSLLDVGHAKLLMWDGRRDALYNQIFGALESAVEMNSSRLFMAERLFTKYRVTYESLFGPMPPLDDAKRFPVIAADRAGPKHGAPGDGAEYDALAPADREAVTRVIVNAGKAIGAYERRLRCGASRFDAYMHGDPAALSPSELRGAKLFVGKGKCSQCHSGPYFSDQQFHNVGLKPSIVAVVIIDTDDHGARDGVALAQADPLRVGGAFSDGDDGRLAAVAPRDNRFKTPMLRCSSRRPTFMHTGQLHSLEAVVEHFDRGGDSAGYPGENELVPLGLSEGERADLAAFIRALDGPGADPAYRAP